MVLLRKKTEKIQMGGYSGETLESCVKKYGRKSILEVLKYYEISDELLSEYHYSRLVPMKKKENEKNLVRCPEEEGSCMVEEFHSPSGEYRKGYKYWYVSDPEGTYDYNTWTIFPDGVCEYYVHSEDGGWQYSETGKFEPSKYDEIVEEMGNHKWGWMKEVKFCNIIF